MKNVPPHKQDISLLQEALADFFRRVDCGDALNNIEQEMQPLEALEKQLWIAGKMHPAEVDQDALLKEYQVRTSNCVWTDSQAGERTNQELEARLKQLDQLHHKRLEKYALLRQLGICRDQDHNAPQAPLTVSPTQDTAVWLCLLVTISFLT